MATTPIVTDMKVIPVAGYDSMEMTLSGAHAPLFTRNLVILHDSTGHEGIGEIHGGEYTKECLDSYIPLVVGQEIGKYRSILGTIHRGGKKAEGDDGEGIQTLDISKLKDRRTIAIPVNANVSVPDGTKVKVSLTNGSFSEEFEIPVKEVELRNRWQ